MVFRTINLALCIVIDLTLHIIIWDGKNSLSVLFKKSKNSVLHILLDRDINRDWLGVYYPKNSIVFLCFFTLYVIAMSRNLWDKILPNLICKIFIKNYIDSIFALFIHQRTLLCYFCDEHYGCISVSIG